MKAWVFTRHHFTLDNNTLIFYASSMLSCASNFSEGQKTAHFIGGFGTMTVLTRWDQFRELNALQQRMNRLFEEQYGGGREESLTTGAFAPPESCPIQDEPGAGGMLRI